MWRVLAIFSLLYTTLCVSPKKDLAEVMEKMEKSRMMGVDTVHNVKIDKDTIITRNMKLEQRGRGKKGDNRNEEGAPDWSYKAIPKEVSAHVQQFKQNMTECLKEVQAKDRRPVKRLSPKTESPVHGECLIACVLRRNGVIEKGGKINKGISPLVCSVAGTGVESFGKNLSEAVDVAVQHKYLRGNLMTLVSKFYSKDTKIMKKLEKNLDRCVERSVHHLDECAVASALNDCTNEIMAANKRDVLVVNY